MDKSYCLYVQIILINFKKPNYLIIALIFMRGFPGKDSQLVKNLPAVQETQVQSLGGKYPLEKEMATHSSILAWKIPWTEDPGRLQSMGSQRVRHNLETKPPNFLKGKH